MLLSLRHTQTLLPWCLQSRITRHRCCTATGVFALAFVTRPIGAIVFGEGLMSRHQNDKTPAHLTSRACTLQIVTLATRLIETFWQRFQQPSQQGSSPQRLSAAFLRQ